MASKIHTTETIDKDGAKHIVEEWKTDAGKSHVFEFFPSDGKGLLRIADHKLWGALVLRDGGYALRADDSGALIDPRTM